MGGKIWKQIKQSLDHNTLDFKYTTRKYLEEHPDRLTEEEYRALTDIANSAFDYLGRWSSNIARDPSLRAVSRLCSQEELMKTVDYKDEQVYMLAELFNEMARSARKNHRCYDCGTSARAVFLKLLETYRGSYQLGEGETRELQRTYKPRQGAQSACDHARRCFRRLKGMKSSGICIMSIGLGDIGHVWVIEKIVPQKGEPIYRHYQSSLNSHMLIDFLEEMDYGAYPKRNINLEDFRDSLLEILVRDKAWEERHYKLFRELFAFDYRQSIDNPQPSFCYAIFSYT